MVGLRSRDPGDSVPVRSTGGGGVEPFGRARRFSKWIIRREDEPDEDENEADENEADEDENEADENEADENEADENEADENEAHEDEEDETT